MHLKFGHPADYMHIIKDNTLKNLFLCEVNFIKTRLLERYYYTVGLPGLMYFAAYFLCQKCFIILLYIYTIFVHSGIVISVPLNY